MFMEAVNELWSSVQPVVSSAPVLVILLGLLVFGIVKKVIKLIVTVGVLVLIWLILQYLGVPMPV